MSLHIHFTKFFGSELSVASVFSGKSGTVLDQPAAASLQSSCPAAPADSLAVKDAILDVVLAHAVAAPLIDVSGPVLRMEPTAVFVNHDSDALIEPVAAAFAAVDTQIVPADVLLTDPAVLCVSDTAPAFVGVLKGVDLLATKVLRCEPAVAKSVAVNAANAAVTAPFDNILTKVADVLS